MQVLYLFIFWCRILSVTIVMPIYLCMPTEIQKLHRLPYFCVAASAAAFAAWAAAF